MADRSAPRTTKLSPELIAIIALGVTVLLAVFGQAAWLDGKIERMGDRLGADISVLDTKVDAIDKRLAVVESHVLGVPSVAQADPPPAATP